MVDSVRAWGRRSVKDEGLMWLHLARRIRGIGEGEGVGGGGGNRIVAGRSCSV